MPMLKRRLEQLHMAARTTPQSESIQSVIQKTESALSYASARLDEKRKPSVSPDARDLPASAIDHAGEVDRIRGQDKEAGRKRQTPRS